MKNLVKTKIALMFLILFGVSFVMSQEASALSEQGCITVKVNGNFIKLDASPYIKENRTYIPVRSISNALGIDVKWIEEENKVVLIDGEKDIEMLLGSNDVLVDNEKKAMDSATELSNGRIMIPVRFVSENLGCSVKWDDYSYSVLVDREELEVPEKFIDKDHYTDEDLMWLARIVEVEARGTSYECKVAIANVVLNRKNSSEFPDTIYDVIFDRSYCVQFPPAYKSGFKELKPSKDCIVASKMALEGENNIDNCLYFRDSKLKGRSIYKKIDGMYFYK